MAQQTIRVHDTRPSRPATRPVAWLVLGLVLLAAAVATAGVVTLQRSGQSAARAASGVVRARVPQAAAAVLTGSPEIASAGTARALLVRAPSVVVASQASRANVVAAGAIARRAHAPMVLLPATATTAQVSALRDTIKALGPSAVLGIGVARHALAADLPGIRIVASATALPTVTAAAPMRNVAVLVHTDPSADATALAVAATATAQAAGARVIELSGYDPRAEPAVIRTLSAARPQRVIAVGAGFGTDGLLRARVAVAETGVQLPGGGQVLFPARRIVALYGTPGTPALGVLGHQGLTASITRAKATAAQYTRLAHVPVIPAFEIIATVAQASPGPLGIYSFEASVSSLRPWVTAASKAGMYVTLDLQPGRANLLAQAKRYQSLLALPNVGLALDPEWKLQPGQRPLRQIGHVSITEVNSVVTWLAALTARYHLPQKLLELHEFRLSMIQGIAQLDTHHDDLAILINMDGQGAPSVKLQTWQAVVANAPNGVYFGWKDFYTKDRPMLGPVRTIGHHPQPVLISYQ
jgi:hypothetical protein